jgi:hypothetical protein
MSEEGDTFYVSLAEKLLGLLLIVIGAIMIYLTASTSALGAFSLFFGIVSVIAVIIGLFLMLARPSE